LWNGRRITISGTAGSWRCERISRRGTSGASKGARRPGISQSVSGFLFGVVFQLLVIRFLVLVEVFVVLVHRGFEFFVVGTTSWARVLSVHVGTSRPARSKPCAS